MKPVENPGRRDKAVAALLWYGTWLASALIAAGVAIMTVEPLQATLSLSISGYDIVKAGIAVFILLPITRVVLVMYLFLRERDYVYAVIAAMVLTIILLGIVFG
ncbi:DUF1634 domain-containing protein [Brucella oryzae]|uniref:DUF1634 domain-containing protein n=1 Tax=Brucella oryzae TaxID=335286 RepID=UPI001B825524|nr:DUF1634 domain-containing protein [Brucella oryzae]MBR7654495.1 DUF1634 domain-containing protein [Brucella oryzae]